MKKILIGDTLRLDVAELIESRLLIQANSGGGKSHTIRRLLEQSHGQVQQIVLDPEGEFSTLRERFDYVLAGKGGDLPADPRSAGLLATKLLETGVSAVIDLYELPKPERKRFVRLFLEAMVNAPKELWHPCLVVVDEAHVFCPEQGEAESTEAVNDLMSRGRKRGFCGILATQRLAKLSKDAAAECNNKLIGRASQDVDRKRSADELGFTTKEQVLSLRSLPKGDFYAFGPAISGEVSRVHVGPVLTSHPKIGTAARVAKPTAAIRSVLAKLGDLPKEAEEEARTSADLKRQVEELQRELAAARRHQCQAEKENPGTEARAMKAAADAANKEWRVRLKKELEGLKTIQERITAYAIKLDMDIDAAKNWRERVENEMRGSAIAGREEMTRGPINEPIAPVIRSLEPSRPKSMVGGEVSVLGTGERKIMVAIGQHGPGGITREHLTVLTGYKRSSRDTYLQRLRQKGLIDDHGTRMVMRPEGLEALGGRIEQLPTGPELREHVLQTLPEGERKILGVLIEFYPAAVERERLDEMTGYRRSSRDTYLQRLAVRELVRQEGRGSVRASDHLF